MKKILPFLLFLLLCLPMKVQAQSANDLINAVNAMRVHYGLEMYTVDPALMDLAQEHSDYQATVGHSTHERADGSGVPCRSENVCAGAGLDANYCVNTMWTDELHRYTMIGMDSGTVGAGVAWADGQIYYTLMVNSQGQDTGLNTYVSANENAGQEQIDINSALVQPGTFATSTPELDGSIYHTVQTNETLWSISESYGVTMDEIRQLNGMEEGDTDVTAGKRILIHYGGTPVADTATPTTTPLPVTNTPKPTSTATATLPPLPTFTPTITNTPTPAPLIKHISYFDTPGAKTLGTFLTIFCSLGLMATLYFGFIRKP